MAQIPTSSITMAAIIAEVGLSGSKTLDQCRAASVAFAMTSTSVPGHTRDGNEQTNTNASPWNNTMAEWAGYTHSQDIEVQEYLTIFIIDDGGWPQTGYGLYQTSIEGLQPTESTADGGIYLFTKQVGGSTWVYADRLVMSENDVSANVGRRYTATSTFDSMGSHTTNDGTGADVIIKIDEANVTVTATASAIFGWGDEPYLSGKDTPSLVQNSGATYVAGSAQGAADVTVSGGGGHETSGSIFRLRLVASKSGFNDTLLDGDRTDGELGVYSYHEANSDEEEG